MWKIVEIAVKEALQFFSKPNVKVLAEGAKKVMEAAAKTGAKKV